MYKIDTVLNWISYLEIIADLGATLAWLSDFAQSRSWPLLFLSLFCEYIFEIKIIITLSTKISFYAAE